MLSERMSPKCCLCRQLIGFQTASVVLLFSVGNEVNVVVAEAADAAV